MSLAHVVLSLLVRKSGHGYGLHARIGAELGLAPPPESSHVYGALAALERAGLVEGRVERPSARLRRTFAVTAAGHERLRSWIDRPGDDRALLRRPLLVKAAVWLHLRQRPLSRTLRAERAQRTRQIAAHRVPARSPLEALLRSRARRHLEVELWLLDRLAPATRLDPASVREP
jgi:DNA-binding PadR family transcriptional regulator